MRILYVLGGSERGAKRCAVRRLMPAYYEGKSGEKSAGLCDMLVVRGGMKLHIYTRCLGLWREVPRNFTKGNGARAVLSVLISGGALWCENEQTQIPHAEGAGEGGGSVFSLDLADADG